MNAEVTTEQLLSDLRAVISDAEALLKATSGATGDRIQEVRARAEESLRQARERVGQIEQDAVKAAQEMATAAEEYVRDNPWQSIGVAAGVGLIVGLILGRR